MRYLVSITLVLTMVACAPTTPRSETTAKSLAENPGDSPPADGPLTFQPQSQDLESILSEVARGRSQEELAKTAAARSHYQIALAYHNRGEFEKARIEAQKGLEADPDKLAVRKLLKDVQQVTAGGRTEFGARSIAEDAAADPLHHHGTWVSLEINKHVRDGERYFNAEMYDEALREFENAEFRIMEIPYAVKEALDLLPGVKEFIAKSKNAQGLKKRRDGAEK